MKKAHKITENDIIHFKPKVLVASSSNEHKALMAVVEFLKPPKIIFEIYKHDKYVLKTDETDIAILTYNNT